jgi:hypothetical protein
MSLPLPLPLLLLLAALLPARVLYTTQGVKKTKLGLREFIKLGAFEQHIDRENALAVRASNAPDSFCGNLSACDDF